MLVNNWANKFENHVVYILVAFSSNIKHHTLSDRILKPKVGGYGCVYNSLDRAVTI